MKKEPKKKKKKGKSSQGNGLLCGVRCPWGQTWDRIGEAYRMRFREAKMRARGALAHTHTKKK